MAMVLLKESPHDLQEHLLAKQLFVIISSQKGLRGEWVLFCHCKCFRKALLMLPVIMFSFLFQATNTTNNRLGSRVPAYECANGMAERECSPVRHLDLRTADGWLRPDLRCHLCLYIRNAPDFCGR